MFSLKRILTFAWRFSRLMVSIFAFLVLSCAAAWFVEPELPSDLSGALTIWLIDLLGVPGFFLAVLIGALPGVIALLVALALAADFVRGMYGLKSWSEGRSHVARSLFGQPSFSPYLIIREGRVVQPPEHTLRRVGGPGNLIVYNDSAVVTEQGGRLKRVLLGPSFPKLEPFEKVWEVIDLRPKRWVYDVSAMTKEGIPVTVPADVRFKIEDGGQEPAEKKPYPALEEAVFAAATGKWMREPDKSEPDRVLDWASRVVIGDTEGILRTIISRLYLDQLIRPVDSHKRHLCQAMWREIEGTVKPYDANWLTNLTAGGGEGSLQAIRAELDKKLKHYLDQLDGGKGHQQQDTRQKIDAQLNYYLDRLIWPRKDSQNRPRQALWEEMEERLNPYLEQLTGAETKGETGAQSPRQTIAKELEEELKKSVSGLGAKILGVTLGEIRLADEVFNQWVESWQAEWESWSEGLKAEWDAQKELALVTTGAGAQRKLFTDITQVFEDFEKEKTEGKDFRKLVTMRLIKVLEGASLDPYTRMFLPDQALRTLANLQALYADLLAGEQEDLDLFKGLPGPGGP
jgi:regulator of protease activity HflC (stomatin/prohibitin superfamily)